MAIDTDRVDAQDVQLISVSETAIARLKELISQQEGAGPSLGLRVFVYPGGCSGMSYGMAFEDQPAEDDLTLDINGVKLYVDEMSAQYIAGSQIDYEDNLLGGGFRILNPNAVRTCGCGHSFDTGNDASTARGCACH